MRERVLIIACLLSCIVFIITNFFFWTEEFNSSLEFAKSLQKGGGKPLAYVFLLITYLGFPIIPCFPLIPIIFSREKWLAYKCAVHISISGYLIGILKIIYASPRPWWVDPELGILDPCQATDFGRPSGHAFISLFAILFLYKCYIYDHEINRYSARIKINPSDSEDSNNANRLSAELLDREIGPAEIAIKTNKTPPSVEYPESRMDTKKAIWLAVGIVLIILVGLSRIYLGAHSYEQILLGWSYGMIFYLGTVYIWNERVETMFNYFIDGHHRQNFAKIFLFALVIYISCLILPVVLMVIDKANGDIKQAWVDTIAKTCGGYPELRGIEAMSLYLCVSIAITFGIIFGLMFATTNVMRTPEGLNRKQWVLRKLLAIVVYALIALVFLKLIPIASYYSFFLVNANMCLLLLLFSACVFVPMLYKKMMLDVGENYLKIESQPIMETRTP